MLRWISRCLPGFSIIALLLLLVFAFVDTAKWFPPPWDSLAPPATGDPSKATPGPLTLAQKIFIAYTIVVHVNGFVFAVRLSWALSRVITETQAVLQRRAWTKPCASQDPGDGHFVDSPTVQRRQSLPEADQPICKSNDVDDPDAHDGEVVHAIILPNYREDIDTLRTTLSVLASHPRAPSRYEVYLAMEEKEAEAPSKAATLISVFEKAFLNIRSTFHPAGLPGEIAGKGSNVAYAARRIIQIHRANPNVKLNNVIITVMDADTHLSQDYFTEIRRLHYKHIAEADRSFYSCPIIFDRNSHETPILVRCADLMWGFAGLSAMYPGSAISIPTSVYSLPLVLAERVGGWDGDPTAIGEDMHMLLKCYFETGGDIVSRVIYSPASQCNISSNLHRGWRRVLDTGLARYRQALRHMWGALDTGFAVRKLVANLLPRGALRLRHLFLMHLLWEAHFLPCHLTIVLLFSSLYTIYTPDNLIHPALGWTFRFTGLLRGLSFAWMNLAIFLYDRWHAICLNARANDMARAGISDTGFSYRTWWHLRHLLERICFPIAGTVFGSIPAVQAEISHFWTDRLVYRVSQKPVFTPVTSDRVACSV